MKKRCLQSKPFLKLVLLAMLAPFFSHAVFAQNSVAASLEARVDKTTVHLGEPLTYTLESIQSGSEINAPSPPSFQDFSVTDTLTSSNTTLMNNEVKVVIQQKYVLLPLKKGIFTIEAAALHYQNPKTGKMEEVRSKSIAIKVVGGVRSNRQTTPSAPAVVVPSPVPTQEEIKDIKGVLPAAGRAPWWFLAIAAAGVLGIAVLSILRRREPRSPVETQPSLSPEAEARAELQRAIKFKNNGDIPAYYLALSWAIRQYLGRRYGVIAKESTTRELLTRLKPLKISGEQIDLVRELLDECDLVKFAKFSPDTRDAGAAFEKAQKIITMK